MSSNNYMLYAAQNGLSYEDYTEVSTGWGVNTHDPFCDDSYSNCLALARDCCGDRFTNGANGAALSDECCASCAVYDATAACVATNGGSNADDHPHNVDTPDGVGAAQGPPATTDGPAEEDLVNADGRLGCGAACTSSNECYTGMYC